MTTKRRNDRSVYHNFIIHSVLYIFWYMNNEIRFWIFCIKYLQQLIYIDNPFRQILFNDLQITNYEFSKYDQKLDLKNKSETQKLKKQIFKWFIKQMDIWCWAEASKCRQQNKGVKRTLSSKNKSCSFT